MLPWDLFGRTLIAGLHKYIPYLGEKKTHYKQMLLKKNIL